MSQRLLSLAVRNWPEYHGSCLNRGMRPLELPLPWLLDSIYAWAIDGADAKERMKFDAQLTMPPAGATDVAEDDETWGDDALFEQFLGAAQGQYAG